MQPESAKIHLNDAHKETVQLGETVLTRGNVILSASSQSPRRHLRGVFRSDGNTRFECSTDLLTLESDSTGSHAPVVGGFGQ